MFGKNPRMNPLESRKQLLIAESELNRAQLVLDWQTMADEAHALAIHARTMSSFASATATLAASLAGFWRKKSAPADGKPSWWRTLLSGALLAGTLWSKLRPGPKP
jgi:hypothetical protein